MGHYQVMPNMECIIKSKGSPASNSCCTLLSYMAHPPVRKTELIGCNNDQCCQNKQNKYGKKNNLTTNNRF